MTLAAGSALPEFVVSSVDAARMKLVSALMRDPNPIHFDPEEAQRLGFGQRTVNQGPLNIAYVLNMLAAAAGGTENIKSLKLRLTGNAFAGDRLMAGGRIVSVENGRAACEVWLEREGHGRIAEGAAVIIIPDAAHG